MPDSSSSSISFLTLRISIRVPLGSLLHRLCSISLRSVAGQLVCRRAQCELVADRPEAGDASDRNVGEIGALPEALARMNVREMHLDERNLHGEQRVPERDARVREPGGVEDDEGHVTRGRLMDACDQVGLRVALERGEAMTRFRRELCHLLVDLLQADVSVQPGLAHAQQVEVGTVEQQDVSHGPPRISSDGSEFSADCRQMATVRPDWGYLSSGFAERSRLRGLFRYPLAPEGVSSPRH